MHITLEKIEEKINFLKSIYDSVRLVDPVEKSVLKYDKDTVTKIDNFCYEYWKSGKICENCISIRAYRNNKTCMKLEYKPESIMLVTAIPLEKTQSPLVLELVKNVTESMVFVSDDHGGEHLLYDLVSNFNDMTIRDELTYLFNRRYVNERLPVDIINASRADTPLSVIFLDVDNLKGVNDEYGHCMGDLVIKEVGSAIKKSIRSDKDWVARHGGDEFLICLNNTSYDKAHHISQRIHKNIEKISIPAKDKNIQVAVSMGIYTTYGSEITAEEIINLADKNMYKAKKRRA